METKPGNRDGPARHVVTGIVDVLQVKRSEKPSP